MTMCDKCFMPGLCCKDFVLSIRPPDHIIPCKEAINSWLKEILPEMIGYTVPFTFSRIDAQGWLRYECPALTKAGRCSIYERRPQCCVDYPPGGVPSCCHYGTREAGDGSANIAYEEVFDRIDPDSEAGKIS